MKRRSGFLQVLLLGAAPTPARLWCYALGILGTALTGDLLFALLTERLVTWPPYIAFLVPIGMLGLPGYLALLVGTNVALIANLVGNSPGHALALFAAVGLYLAAYLFYRTDVRREVALDVGEHPAAARRGLIWLFGPGRYDHLLLALQHHAAAGGKKHCWLIKQEGNANVARAFADFCRACEAAGLAFDIHEVGIRTTDMEPTYEAVRDVIESRALKEGLAKDQLMLDITGGTKPMTAGMILAAMTEGCDVEYVESERDAKGDVIEGSQRIMQLDTTFYLTSS